MSHINPGVMGAIHFHLEAAERNIIVGGYNPDNDYWSADECLQRAKHSLLQAIAYIDAELQPKSEAAE